MLTTGYNFALYPAKQTLKYFMQIRGPKYSKEYMEHCKHNFIAA